MARLTIQPREMAPSSQMDPCSGAATEAMADPPHPRAIDEARPAPPLVAAQGRGRARLHRRAATETLIQRAQHLPPETRALAHAYFALGMELRELALLHHRTPRQMRRRIERLRETLSDPAFVMAALYADRLPRAVAALAKAYWIEGITIRALAASDSQSIHAIRRRLAEARSLLLLELRNEQEVPAALAQKALARRNRFAHHRPIHRE